MDSRSWNTIHLIAHPSADLLFCQNLPIPSRSGTAESRQQLIHFLDPPSEDQEDSADSSSSSLTCWNSNVSVKNSGHLLVQEKPEAMGLILAEWLGEVYDASRKKMDGKKRLMSKL